MLNLGVTCVLEDTRTANVKFHKVKSIRTYHPRRGRLSGRHHDALGRLLPELGVPAEGPVTAAALFGVDVPELFIDRWEPEEE